MILSSLSANQPTPPQRSSTAKEPTKEEWLIGALIVTTVVAVSPSAHSASLSACCLDQLGFALCKDKGLDEQCKRCGSHTIAILGINTSKNQLCEAQQGVAHQVSCDNCACKSGHLQSSHPQEPSSRARLGKQLHDGAWTHFLLHLPRGRSN